MFWSPFPFPSSSPVQYCSQSPPIALSLSEAVLCGPLSGSKTLLVRLLRCVHLCQY
ncbi:hypothetical protein CROQUDRAFT_89656 [Cronartium quercuum f. sp. fusiforme G11]|uniref:Uncharacterized protein n=1 Tax=Cronartium quercuum f. sp. fusiforme G11 TaxID=708437 RepID=A0A9P6TEU4_9BASI|nr:hypothetical protein CROQUDRAFT_89656 [Cronartium quercuum f. sp. fusiforme G11]